MAVVDKVPAEKQVVEDNVVVVEMAVVDTLAGDDRLGLDKKAGDSNLEVADKLVAVGRHREEGVVDIAAAELVVEKMLAVADVVVVLGIVADVEVIVVVVVLGVVVVEDFLLGSKDLVYVDFSDSWCLPRECLIFFVIKRKSLV